VFTSAMGFILGLRWVAALVESVVGGGCGTLAVYMQCCCLI
jgi:hypothetical protein